MPFLGFKTIYFKGNYGSYSSYDEHDPISWWSRGLNAYITDRFEDNGNGTVVDTVTGLTWLQKTNTSGVLNWADAITYCHNLADNGTTLTDGSTQGMWRLPNAKECISLLIYGYNPALPTHPFTSVVANCWTSTTDFGNSDFALQLGLTTGILSSISKTSITNYPYAWPVRS